MPTRLRLGLQSAIKDRKELCNGEDKMRNVAGTSKKCMHFSSRVGWAKKKLRFIKNVSRKKRMQFLADLWVICSVFDWFIGGLNGLWVVSSFISNEYVLQN